MKGRGRRRKKGFSEHEAERTDSPQLLEVVTHGIFENVKGTAPLSRRDSGCVWQALSTGIHCDPGRHTSRVKVIHSAAQALRKNVTSSVKRANRASPDQMGAARGQAKQKFFCFALYFTLQYPVQSVFFFSPTQNTLCRRQYKAPLAITSISLPPGRQSISDTK